MNSAVTPSIDPAPAIAEVKADGSQLALERTRLAFERTTMAWVRTATSLITFGFSVYKFFNIERGGERAGYLIGPREFGLMMISIGIFSLVLATLQHIRAMRSLRAHAPHMKHQRSLAVLVGVLMSVLGLLALTAVILRR